jgi:hypothetical protein
MALRTTKYILYALVVILIVFLYWFIPKYSFVKKNPGFCTKLTTHLYYCGSGAQLDQLFSK